MPFSCDSEEMMTFMMSDFSRFLKKRTPEEEERLDRIMRNFYNDIGIAHHYIALMWRLNRIKREVREIHTQHEVNHSSLIKSSFVPERIQTYIKANVKGILEYSGSICGKSVKISLYLMTNSQFNELGKYDKLVLRMMTWLRFIFPFMRRKCCTTLKVFGYMTPIKKQTPSYTFTIIGPSHANSGLTNECPVNGEICIYRQEEFFKVFMHESFHSLGMDFSGMPATALTNKMKKLFPITSTMDTSEAYSEFWACIMNCLFTAYYLTADSKNIGQSIFLEDVKTRDDFLLYADYCIHFEVMFALFQCIKVLRCMGLYYTGLYKKDKISTKTRQYLYKEETNVFAYYILKALLLFNNYDFMVWCGINNDNILSFSRRQENLSKFYTFIADRHDQDDFVKQIEKMYLVFKQLEDKKSNDDAVMLRTMRMSIIELI